MNNPDKPFKTLEEWSMPKRVIRGPYAEGESDEDRQLRIEQEEEWQVKRFLICLALAWAVLGIVIAVTYLILR